jgi:hypothetical protein
MLATSSKRDELNYFTTELANLLLKLGEIAKPMLVDKEEVEEEDQVQYNMHNGYVYITNDYFKCV